MEETTAGELADMLLECQLGVNQHAQVTHNSRRLIGIAPIVKLRSAPASC